MILKYKDIYYDKVEDVPLAVLADKNDNSFFVPVNYSIAEEILNYTIAKTDKNFPISELIGDLLLSANGKIESLELVNKRNGEFCGLLTLVTPLFKKEYIFNAGEVILLSLIFKIEISADSRAAQTLYTTNVFLYDSADPDMLN